MTTLDDLKRALRQKLKTSTPQTQPLSDSQYNAGFDILAQASQQIYQDFVIPQLSELLVTRFGSSIGISVLEVGPGPKSVLEHMPTVLKQKIKRYTAFEPNRLFATALENRLHSTSDIGSGLPYLDSPPNIQRVAFGSDITEDIETCTGTKSGNEKFDIVLLCHSMYGMKPKHIFIGKALKVLREDSEGGVVVVCHRDGAMRFDGLVCHQSAVFPAGVVQVADDDQVLDDFAALIAGSVMQDVDADVAIKAEWRKVCRDLGRSEKTQPNQLLFSSPEVMVAFTRHAITLSELLAQVPAATENRKIKNGEARRHSPALIVRPTELRHVQECVRWALKHRTSLTVLGGSHSGHCLWPDVVAIDMSAFNQIHMCKVEVYQGGTIHNPVTVVVVESGCRSGDVIRKTMEAGLTVPLGSRPSVGAGLWLQGGIGHLARLHGLACDSIIGAIVISVASGQILCLGHIPSQCQPLGAVRPENELDLLWGIKGAGTNLGIVVSVTFQTYAAPLYSIRNWIIPLISESETRLLLSNLDYSIAKKLPRNCSIDAYLYKETGRMRLGVTSIEVSTTKPTPEELTDVSALLASVLGRGNCGSKVVDGIDLFETEMYMSSMHGGHGAGRTSSFKRCVFLRHIGAAEVAKALIASVDNCPSPLCYLHMLQGGGAVSELAVDATAFGCRDWDFACVVTGVWLSNQDGTHIAREVVRWVYKTVRALLSLSSGIYGADLGPDPRDATLVAQAFGSNLSRLASLKHASDPSNVLAHACPVLRVPPRQKLIILVTGKHGVGKDHCADIWVAALTTCSHTDLRARTVSISDATKRDYAAATGAVLHRLIHDRQYKEQHRPMLSAFFQQQMRQNPRLMEQHFLDVSKGVSDVDVLFITGMREVSPVTAYSHLVSNCKLLEVRVQARKGARSCEGGIDAFGDREDSQDGEDNNDHPSFVFNNDTMGAEAATSFCEQYLLPLFHPDLHRLANMVRRVSSFPRKDIDFHDLLGISQQPGGLKLCTALLRSHFTGDWAKTDLVACCEAGGFVFASPLAMQVDVPLVLIRKAGKIPPPTITAVKSLSNVSSSALQGSGVEEIEMSKDAIPRDASIVVVDDVLATGNTLCAVLQLLEKAGVGAKNVNILVVAEFPIHRGREMLRRHGFGGAGVQSLLVFDGA